MRHYNPTLNKSMQDIFNLKGESTDEIFDSIIPIVNVDPRIDVVRNNSSSATGTLTLYTTPSGSDFFLTSISGDYIKDVVCDQATGRIQISAIIEGITRDIINFPVITLTAQNGSKSLIFLKPIKIDRNTAITYVSNYAAGVMSRSSTLTGFTVETTKNT